MNKLDIYKLTTWSFFLTPALVIAAQTSVPRRQNPQPPSLWNITQ